MQVRTRLYLSSSFIVILAVSFLLVMGLTSAKIRELSEKQEFARGIQEAISQMNLVMYEYLLSKHERASEQWMIKYTSIRQALEREKTPSQNQVFDAKLEILDELLHDDGALERIKNGELNKVARERISLLRDLISKRPGLSKFQEGALRDLIREDFQNLGDLFQKAVDNTKAREKFMKSGGSLALMFSTVEIEEQVSGLLLLKSQSIIRNASRVAQTSLKRLQRAQETTDRFIFLFITFVIFMVMLTSFGVARSISGPIRKLMYGTREFGRGNLDYQITVQSKDELGQLAGAFNTMSLELKKKMEALASTNHELKQKNDQMQKELELATRIHKTLIPQSMQTEKATIIVHYVPMSFIGGDYAKFHFVNENRLTFIISDVTGHGVGAALLVNRMHAEFEKLSKMGREPGLLLKELNDFITGAFEGTQMFLSAFCGSLDFERQIFQYSNYGHPPQYIYQSRENAVRAMDSQTTLLGIPFHDEMIYQHEAPFNAGDKILMFTDGLIEAKGPDGKLYGTERLAAFLQKHSQLPPQELSQKLMADLDNFKKGDFGDDVFLLTIQINERVLQANRSPRS